MVFFIDNDSARHGLISGYSPLLRSAALISATLVELARIGAFAWFARVPSASNIADGPSRLDFEKLRAWPGSAQVQPRFSGTTPPHIWAELAASLQH